MLGTPFSYCIQVHYNLFSDLNILLLFDTMKLIIQHKFYQKFCSAIVHSIRIFALVCAHACCGEKQLNSPSCFYHMTSLVGKSKCFICQKDHRYYYYYHYQHNIIIITVIIIFKLPHILCIYPSIYSSPEFAYSL